LATEVQTFAFPLGQRLARLPWDLVAPAAVLAGILACLAIPSFLPMPEPVGGSVIDAGHAPLSPGHLFGTDMNGNDVWSRLLFGGRTSITIALGVNGLGLIFGGALGAVSGYFGGFVDGAITRCLDALIAFPALILVLAVAQTLGPGELHTIGALALFSIPAIARISRSATLRVREEPFILAASLSGIPSWRILLEHVAPNIMPQLVAYSLLGMGAVINIEGAVSYLGLGVPLPAPSWGNMIYDGQLSLSAAPRLVLLPCAFLYLTSLSFNQLGEAFRTRWVRH
jgi:peptide/nickel transport system permease protein